MPVIMGRGEERRKELEEALELTVALFPSMDVEKAILIGSLAKGDVHSFSDIDLIIIKKTDLPFFKRFDEFYVKLPVEVGMDILIYTPEEFLEMKDSRGFLRHALKTGKIIYERGS
jgi:predicted nucleotidyltransferase